MASKTVNKDIFVFSYCIQIVSLQEIVSYSLIRDVGFDSVTTKQTVFHGSQKLSSISVLILILYVMPFAGSTAVKKILNVTLESVRHCVQIDTSGLTFFVLVTTWKFIQSLHPDNCAVNG